MRTIWRLTLDCGHFAISGPWDSNADPDHGGRIMHMIGDLYVCLVCPLVPRDGKVWRAEAAIRTIVMADLIDPALYRDPDPYTARGQADQDSDRQALNRRVIALAYAADLREGP